MGHCDLERLPKRYGDLLKIGRQVGIQPTFEYISFFKSIHRLAQAWEVVQETKDPSATLILDAFHNWNSHTTPDELEAIPVDRISHYHIDDAHPAKPAGTQTDPDRVMIGEGVIDLKAEIQCLRQKGYQGAMSLELFNQDLWNKNPKEVLQRVWNACRHCCRVELSACNHHRPLSKGEQGQATSGWVHQADLMSPN